MDYPDLSPEHLLSACIDAPNPSAWEEFIRRFRPLIAGVVANTTGRAGISDMLTIEDLVQEILLKLCSDDCRLLRQFASKSPGSVFSYFKVIAINHVRDRFRTELRQRRYLGSKTSEVLDEGDVVDNRWTVKRIERTVLLMEIERGLDAVLVDPNKERDRAIFSLYYRQGFTANDIAALPGIDLTVKGVESTLARLTRLLRERVEMKEKPASMKGKSAVNTFTNREAL